MQYSVKQHIARRFIDSCLASLASITQRMHLKIQTRAPQSG